MRQYRKRSMKVEVSNGSSFLKRRVMAIRALALVGVIPMEDKENRRRPFYDSGIITLFCNGEQDYDDPGGVLK